MQVEEDDSDSAYIGIPVAWGEESFLLQEVTPQAEWDGTLSEWRYDDVTRVEFSSTYEHDLLLVADPPPSAELQAPT